MSQHASGASRQAATGLASACAMADANAYKMLLPWLEGMMWRGQSSHLQMLAAAGEHSVANEQHRKERKEELMPLGVIVRAPVPEAA